MLLLISGLLCSDGPQIMAVFLWYIIQKQSICIVPHYLTICPAWSISPCCSPQPVPEETHWVTACNWNAGLTDAIFISSWEECLWAPVNKARHETGSSNLPAERNQVYEQRWRSCVNWTQCTLGCGESENNKACPHPYSVYVIERSNFLQNSYTFRLVNIINVCAKQICIMQLVWTGLSSVCTACWKLM